jgi:hypothetical protein
VAARDLPHQRQPQAAAGGIARSGRPVKWLEHLGEFRRRHARTGILDGERRRGGIRRQAHARGRLPVAPRILEQIAQQPP